MKILLTFTGAQDPFAGGSGTAGNAPGSVLTVAAAQQFDLIHLLVTPAAADSSARTKEELQEQNEGLKVEIIDALLKHPDDPSGIPKQLKSLFNKLRKRNPEAEYFICVSSGLPHVDAAWLMLAAGGEIQARILQARRAGFIGAGDGRVVEMDFSDAQSPRIKPFGGMPDADAGYDFQSLSDDLCLVGDHAPFLRELKTAFNMAETDCPILLLGETNTGKEAFARLIHCASKRAARPFIAVNCAPSPDGLVESRLFGHVKDAFTGADREHPGGFAQANGGTLFLDDLDGLPASSQPRLLRAMEQGKIQRLGDDRESSVNVRVIAATSLDIKELGAATKPRKELYQSFYLLRFSARTKAKWDRLLRSPTPALAEDTPARTNIVPLPAADLSGTGSGTKTDGRGSALDCQPT